MKCAITGHTRGLGQYLANYFRALGWEVTGFSRPLGHDLEKDADAIIEQMKSFDLVILNAYANGTQQLYLDRLFGHVKKIIVCGSIAGDGEGDPFLAEYSENKKKLRNRTLDLATIKSNTDILLLKLTSSSYRSPNLIFNSIKFWLENPDVTQISFNIERLPTSV